MNNPITTSFDDDSLISIWLMSIFFNVAQYCCCPIVPETQKNLSGDWRAMEVTSIEAQLGIMASVEQRHKVPFAHTWSSHVLSLLL